MRGQYEGYRTIDGVAADSTTETYAALRLEIDNWRWSGVPFFIRTGKCLPVTQTELRLVFRRPPRLGFATGRERPSPSQLVVKLDPTTGIRLLVDAQRHETVEPEQITLDMEFAQEGGEGPTPYEVLLHAALIGDASGSPARTPSRQCWRVMQPLLDAPAAGAPLREGIVGPGRSRPGARRLRPLARTLGGVMSTTKAKKSAQRDGQPAATRPDEQAAGAAAERRRAVAVPADRGLRVPVGLPYRSAGRAGRVDRLAVRAAVRLAEHFRLAARPQGGLVPPWAVRDQRAERPGAMSRARTRW